MSRRISFFTAALLCTVAFTTGCDGEADDTDALTDTETTVRLTDGGEFYVEFDASDALVGRNSFDLRLTVLDHVDPDSGGYPVHHADLDVNAHMPVDGRATTEPVTVQNLDDGWYRVDGVVLDAEGTWQLDFAFSKGELDDSISFQIEL